MLVWSAAPSSRCECGGSVLRSVFYLPYLIPPVSATVAFVFVNNPSPGPLRRRAPARCAVGPRSLRCHARAFARGRRSSGSRPPPDESRDTS
ncbi:sugar ABC transporter permease [Actinomadura logoneensis]|uniref:Sugar ABC transporter permease n=1 Tax=Actinomadura logoneensis TaxID=2293572 RepID=A0A372JM92_9ACTN|nr:sugar ABC transporter permease [Actinomadura logoneensis]